jgi:flagellar protein FlaJ
MDLKSKRLKQGFRDMKMKPKTYFRLVLISIIVFGLVVPYILSSIIIPQYLNQIMDPSYGFMLYALPIFAIFAVGMLPIIASSKSKMRAERNMPLYVTELAALSTSEMPIEKMFYVMSTKTEYGQLAEDSLRIYRLIKFYHVAAGDACRFVAARTPSPMEADFFSRLSHSMEVGEKLDRFLKNEHEVIMDEYTLKADASLKDLDFVKELFTGIVTSLIFACVFVSIIPLLGQGNVDTLLMGIVMGFAVMEAMFVYFIQTKLPKDDIWYGWRQKKKDRLTKDNDRILMLSVIISLFGTVLLTFLLLPLNLPLGLYASSVFLPFLIPGILITREERNIIKRDNIYGAFIRSLGRASSVSGQTMGEAVRKLAMHKFGPLTSMVKNLSKRLALNINSVDAWNHFSAESSSNMIRKFNGVYTQCVLSGAKSDITSQFISANMFKVMAIRKKRQIVASGYLGVLYGIMISLAFTLYITVGISEYMSNTIQGLSLTNVDGTSGASFLNSLFNSHFDVGPLKLMVFAIIFIHAFFSALMLPMLKGGHMAGAGIHFIAMLWIGSASAFMVDIMLKGLLS